MKASAGERKQQARRDVTTLRPGAPMLLENDNPVSPRNEGSRTSQQAAGVFRPNNIARVHLRVSASGAHDCLVVLLALLTRRKLLQQIPRPGAVISARYWHSSCETMQGQ
jgi:hypothetical protein